MHQALNGANLTGQSILNFLEPAVVKSHLLKKSDFTSDSSKPSPERLVVAG